MAGSSPLKPERMASPCGNRGLGCPIQAFDSDSTEPEVSFLTELSSRPKRSVVEGPAVSVPVLTQTLEPLRHITWRSCAPNQCAVLDEPPLSCFVSGHDFSRAVKKPP